MSADLCPFCTWTDEECLLIGDLVRAHRDKYPVSPGHALVVTRRHVADWWRATNEERVALVRMLDELRIMIERDHSPQGYNIGVNVGEAAGQTVPHLHVHLIPRYAGDVPDPTGGVRGVIPGKANYRELHAPAGAPHGSPLVRGGSADPLLPHLVAHLATATQVDIAVAFVGLEGVRLLFPHLEDVVRRGGHVRLLTGDYLNFTDPDALRQLLDLGDGLELRAVETRGTSFHVKSYVCVTRDGGGSAFVGSSNLTSAALQDGVEWNYRIVTPRDAHGHRVVREGFEALWNDPAAKDVTQDWIREYEARRARVVGVTPGPGPETPDPPPAVPKPHEVQQAALDALAATRAEGNTAGLVVLATGLGKTWLAAFDTERARAKRVLFVAHRDEILDQALKTFRTIRPHATLGKYTGTERTPDADVLFASIQTINRQRHLDQFAPDTFDYVVVDEFHHASAATYRRLLNHFTPRFLLGLTATPERTDGADLLALCGENLVYRCDLVEGIRRGLLSPFDYFGVPDEVDYEQIPWRSKWFDEEKLTTAVATVSRADNALDQLRRRGGSRTLGFCVSQRHADFMARHAADRGWRTAAVHAGETSDPRSLSLERLMRGELEVVFAVDMFNEGVDLPDVDTVLMLRPTESAVLWLQQFGRGLRWRPNKRLKVIDYIGNHRAFLLKPRTLFGLDEGDAEIAQALRLVDEGRGSELLPPGCSVTYDLEARDILRALLRPTNEGVLEFYRDFKARHGMRPTASEVYHALYDPRAVRRSHGSWLQFVRQMGDLDAAHDRAEVELRPFLLELETTPMTKSYKMVVLLAMLAEGAFPGGLTIERLASRVAQLARRTAGVRTELEELLADERALIADLERNPIAAWVGGRGTGGTPYFRYEGGRLQSTVTLPADLREAAADLVRELAEWRLAAYLRRSVMLSGADRIVCKVAQSNGRPMLFLPPRERVAGIPDGWVSVLANGDEYQAKFVKVAVNVVQRPASDENVLPELLRGWFGPDAGQPGSQHAVAFRRSGIRYVLEPAGQEQLRGPQLWATYSRKEIPALFGFEFRGMENQSGVVERQGLMLLFVTLDKSGAPDQHRYEDVFLDATTLRWQSQNRTSQASEAGQRIRQHEERGIAVHLFVRPTAKRNGQTQPFRYCGRLRFDRWEREKPITVWWILAEPVPTQLWNELRITGAEP